MSRINSASVTPVMADADTLELYYGTLLDGLADGVLSVSPDRRIEVLNATGAAILGCAAATVVGRTLLEAFLHEAENDGFIDAVLAPVVQHGGTVKSVVGFRRGTELRQLSVVSTSYRVRTGPRAGDLGIVVTFGDVTEMRRLQAAERSLQAELASEHAKLQTAYLRLEEATARAQRIARRTARLRNSAIVAALVGLGAIIALNWGVVLGAVSPAGSARPVSTAQATLIVHPVRVTSRVAVVGNVEAGSIESVVGPFDGLVQTKNFTYGGPIERGAPLLTLDTADTEVKLRDAQSAEIKARQHLDELRTWSTSPDVSRARRTLTNADLDATSLSSRLTQTKMLLAKGIVAADEYNQLLQQLRTQQLQLQSARQDLDATIARGSPDNVEIAQFELLNAKAKVADLRNDIAHATVLAPVSGVVLQPPESESKHVEIISVGSRVSKGQTMFAIGDLERFSVQANVDEIDINKIHVGQPALVSGDAFDDMVLQGKVTSVAVQATGESALHAGMATFPVTVLIGDPTPEQRGRVHVGMSASVSILAYDNPKAIVVPPAALREQNATRVVRVQRGDTVESLPVTLGISTPEGIEIRSGLKSGDVVLLGD